MTNRGIRIWAMVLVVLVLAIGAHGPVAARDAQPDAATEPLVLRLKYATFDPLQGEPQIDSALRTDAYPDTGEGAYIVQFKGPVQGAWKGQVKALGGQLMDYLPDYAFLVWMDGAARERVAALDIVRWVGLYQPAYKLSPNLDRTQPLYRVVLFEGANLAAVEARLAELNTPTREVPGELFTLVLPEGGVDQVATWPEVLWIENRPVYRLHNDVATGIMGANVAWDSGYTGAGQVVTVADTGIDNGVDNVDMHPDFQGRFDAIYDWYDSFTTDPCGGCSCTVTLDGARDRDGHGTHVLGSVLGNGAASGGEFKGTAPDAIPVFQAVGQYLDYTTFCENLGWEDGVYLLGLPDDLGDLFQEAYDTDSFIHSDSWGAPVNGAYTTDSRVVDQFVWSHPEMLILFSAGNSGVDSSPKDGYVDKDSLDAPGTAKNALTVGASDNERLSGGIQSPWGMLSASAWPLPPTSLDDPSDDAGELAAFSSRGPVDDCIDPNHCRIKPDVVAPGTNILSTRSRSGTGPDWGPYNEFYKYMGGTSMATPLTAGAAALVREYYIEAFGHTPSAALLKATLINSAVDILGYGNSNYEAGKPVPNNHEGWGRVDVGAATSGERQFSDDDLVDKVGTGDRLSYVYDIASSASPLKITLVWSDYPALVSASVDLVNNLDLVVTAPDGSTYLGNVFSGGWSVTDGSADAINNVESVYIQNPAADQWTVEVVGTDVAQPQQPFALVVTGDFGPPPEPPIASFSGSPTTGEASLLVSFTDLSSGAIDDWAWDFGDGDTSTLRHPTHEYTAAGDYTVSLTVTGPGGSDTHEEIDYINVTAPPPPVADFSGTPTSGDALLNVSFIDESTGVITAWAWDFGDGSTSTLENPNHIYKDVGDYTVSLTVTGPGGSQTMTKDNYIQVTGPPQRVYLPLVLRAYAPPVPDDPIVNGDFEDGPVAWQESSLYLYPIVVDRAYGIPVQPHSGDWLAWLGGASYELAYIQQAVAIPSGRSYLHFWHWLYSPNAVCTTDRASVQVDGTEVKTYLLCTSTSTGGWVEQVADLSAYAGQSVVLKFGIETGALVSGWYVDDVSFEVSAATADVSLPLAPDPGIGTAKMVKPAPDLQP